MVPNRFQLQELGLDSLTLSEYITVTKSRYDVKRDIADLEIRIRLGVFMSFRTFISTFFRNLNAFWRFFNLIFSYSSYCHSAGTPSVLKSDASTKQAQNWGWNRNVSISGHYRAFFTSLVRHGLPFPLSHSPSIVMEKQSFSERMSLSSTRKTSLTSRSEIPQKQSIGAKETETNILSESRDERRIFLQINSNSYRHSKYSLASDSYSIFTYPECEISFQADPISSRMILRMIPWIIPRMILRRPLPFFSDQSLEELRISER